MIGWSIGLFAFLVYLGTLSRHYSADSLIYALQIENREPGQIIDPTHVLIELSGLAWYRLWQALGWAGGSLTPLQVINALAGAVSVGLLYGIGYGVTGSRRTAGLASLGFAVSGGLWLLSVEAEFATLPLAAALLVLWLTLTAPKGLAQRKALYAVALGAALALAILFYLNSIILIVVVAAGLLLRERQDRRMGLAQLATAIAVVVIVCLPVAAALLSNRSWSEWTQVIWQEGGSGYMALTWLDGPHGLYAFLRSLGLFPGQALNDSGRAMLGEAAWGKRLAFGALYGVLFLIALAPVVAAIRMRQKLWARHRREVIVLMIWTLLYGGFAIYWVPGDITFWAPVLAAWWLLAALVATLAASTGRERGDEDGTVRPARRMLPEWPQVSGNAALAGLVLLLAILNVATVIWPRRDLGTNRAYQLAMEVQRQTEPVDLIVTEGDEIVALYVAYFGKRTVLPAAEMVEDREAFRRHYGPLLEETSLKGGQTYKLKGEELVFLTP